VNFRFWEHLNGLLIADLGRYLPSRDLRNERRLIAIRWFESAVPDSAESGLQRDQARR